MSTPSPPAAPKSRGRLLLWAGVLAALLGLVLYALQLRAAVLVTPWYAPALAVLGTGLILLSLLRRRTVWRGAALLLLAALTLGECWFLYSYASLPDYSGRVGVGDSFPEFTAARADGTPFTRADLVGEQDTVLVFFRGWW
jgi:hypothetical protein